MRRIVVFGGTGYAGSAIAREAASRGHSVTTVSRGEPERPIAGATHVVGSVLDGELRSRLVGDADDVVFALAPRGDMADLLRPAAAAVAVDVAAAGARLGVVGGAGSLRRSEDGPRMVDSPELPAAAHPEAATMTAVLDDLLADESGLDWFLLSPALEFGAHRPGERTGAYRLGRDVLVVDADGRSAISGADYAIAFVDEIERPAHRRLRFTVAY